MDRRAGWECPPTRRRGSSTMGMFAVIARRESGGCRALGRQSVLCAVTLQCKGPIGRLEQKALKQTSQVPAAHQVETLFAAGPSIHLKPTHLLAGGTTGGISTAGPPVSCSQSPSSLATRVFWICRGSPSHYPYRRVQSLGSSQSGRNTRTRMRTTRARLTFPRRSLRRATDSSRTARSAQLIPALVHRISNLLSP